MSQAENLDLSNLGSFEAVKHELGITLMKSEGLYRRVTDNRIVLFRAQEIEYPDELRISHEGEYGAGAYFGNSPSAVATYVVHRGQCVQAYLLPEIDESAIRHVSHFSARHNRHLDAQHLLEVFPVGMSVRIEERLIRKNAERSGIPLWARMPVPSAETLIENTRKLANLGHIGIGEPRFRRR